MEPLVDFGGSARGDVMRFISVIKGSNLPNPGDLREWIIKFQQGSVSLVFF